LAKLRPDPSQPRKPLGNQHRLLSFVYLGSFLDDWANLGWASATWKHLRR
jgi:hypothetical protein